MGTGPTSAARTVWKLGNHAQDTSEIFFSEVRLPAGSLLGQKGRGFECLMHGLARERLTICVNCQARAEAVLRDTAAYAAGRQVFGAPLSQLQNARFVVGAVKPELIAGRALVDGVLLDYRLDSATASAARLRVTDALGRTVDACPVARRLGLHERVPHTTGLCQRPGERMAGGRSES